MHHFINLVQRIIMTGSSNFLDRYVEPIKIYCVSKREEYRPWWEPKYNKIAGKCKEHYTKSESEFNKIVEKYEEHLPEWVPKWVINYKFPIAVAAGVIGAGSAVYKIGSNYLSPPSPGDGAGSASPNQGGKETLQSGTPTSSLLSPDGDTSSPTTENRREGGGGQYTSSTSSATSPTDGADSPTTGTSKKVTLKHNTSRDSSSLSTDGGPELLSKESAATLLIYTVTARPQCSGLHSENSTFVTQNQFVSAAKSRYVGTTTEQISSTPECLSEESAEHEDYDDSSTTLFPHTVPHGQSLASARLTFMKKRDYYLQQEEDAQKNVGTKKSSESPRPSSLSDRSGKEKDEESTDAGQYQNVDWYSDNNESSTTDVCVIG